MVASSPTVDSETTVRRGERYRSVTDLTMTVMTSWSAPYTGGSEAILPAGEIFAVLNDPPAQATAVYCRPDNYRRLHKRYVRWQDRWHPFYRGYYLAIRLEQIAAHCELLS